MNTYYISNICLKTKLKFLLPTKHNKDITYTICTEPTLICDTHNAIYVLGINSFVSACALHGNLIASKKSFTICFYTDDVKKEIERLIFFLQNETNAAKLFNNKFSIISNRPIDEKSGIIYHIYNNTINTLDNFKYAKKYYLFGKDNYYICNGINISSLQQNNIDKEEKQNIQNEEEIIVVDRRKNG